MSGLYRHIGGSLDVEGPHVTGAACALSQWDAAWNGVQVTVLGEFLSRSFFHDFGIPEYVLFVNHKDMWPVGRCTALVLVAVREVEGGYLWCLDSQTLNSARSDYCAFNPLYCGGLGSLP